MHGGANNAGDSHHVLVSIMDEKTGKPVAKATVEGRVGEIGLSVTGKKLEPMIIAETTTYGNFFPMRGTGPFQIDVEFRLSGSSHFFSCLRNTAPIFSGCYRGCSSPPAR